MRTGPWTWWVAAAGALVSAGCNNSSSSSAAAPPPATSQGALTMTIESVTLPDGAGARPVVRFKVVDNTTGNPLDLPKEIAASNANPKGIPNTVPRFTLAQRDDRNDYRSYYATTANPKAYTVPEGEVAPPTSSQLQASAQPPTSPYPLGDLKDVGGGSFELTLPPVNQTGFDRSKTHTVAGWSVRSNGTADSDVAAASLDFVPSGASSATSYQTVTDARCNQCHGFVQAHGSRRTVPLCITCHNPSTGDPETSRTVDFKVMIHKIHSGETLPSVQQGKGYFIVGFNQTVADFSDVVFPYHNHGVAHCTVCHSGGAQSSNWSKIPTQAVCTSCHDNVQFASGSGLDPCPVGSLAAANFKDCMHAGGPITISDPRDPSACLGCHGPGTVAAIDKFHHGD
jgi:OmcA/MtrC family decaheme c-type cytochrome